MMNTSSSYYDNLAGEYRETCNRRLPYLLGVEKVVADILLSSENARLLDIGTGDGVRLARILKGVDGVEAVAVEQSGEMYRLAQKNIPNVKVINDDFAAIDISANHFTHVTALWNVIGHVKNRALFLESIYNILSHNGIFVFDVNNRYNIKAYGPVNVIKNFCIDLFHPDASGKYALQCKGVETEVFIYNEKLLRADLKLAGFSIKEIMYINYANGDREKFPIGGQILCVAFKE